MKILSILILTLISFNIQAQFFQPISKPVAARNIRPATAAVSTAITENTFRPIVNVGSYLIGSPENALLTGGGISYQHLQYDAVKERWNAVWSINALAWGKVVTNNSTGAENAFMYGLAVGFLNNMVLIGAATDGKKVYPTAGFGINFNN